MEVVEYDAFYTVKAELHGSDADGVAINREGGGVTMTSENRSGYADGACVRSRLNFSCYIPALPEDCG